MGSPQVTHSELCQRAGRWLRSHGCVVIGTEIVSSTREIPDAIGWTYHGVSKLVECKVSRSDFFADRSKSFRAHPASGMGRFRYYATPKGLIRPDELPDKWGLIEVSGSGLRIVLRAESHSSYNLQAELALMATLTRFRDRHVEAGRMLTNP